MAATRLPGKPLADIAGEPMIVHVLRRAQAADIGRGAVATDSAAIAAAVDKAGGTRGDDAADHASGSDRIFEALGKLDPRGADRNRHQPARRFADHRARSDSRARSFRSPTRPSTSRRSPPRSQAARERDNPNVVKVVGTPVGPARLRALYFTRATAPCGEGPLYHHIGLYAYRRAALERFVSLPPSPLERREKLEQLRALEAGMRIDVCHRRDRAARRRYAGGFGKGARHANGTSRTARGMMKRKKALHRRSARHSIAFQGEPGANSHIACRRGLSGHEPLPCPTFEDAFAAVRTGKAALAMIPIDNSVAGRVADIHHLMPASRLHIVAEWFLPVQHQLMAPKGATLKTIKTVGKPCACARPMPQHHPGFET